MAGGPQMRPNGGGPTVTPPTKSAPKPAPISPQQAAINARTRAQANSSSGIPKPNLRYPVPTGVPTPTRGVPDLRPVAPIVNTNPAGSVPTVPSNYSSLFNTILQKALKLYQSPNPAAKSLLQPNAILGNLGSSVIDPTQIGNDAGLGYDAQIAGLNANLQTTKDQNAQDQADIQNWYNQVSGAQTKAAASNASELANQLSGQSDAAQAFMNALGGSASGGAAGIANASDIASAALRAMGVSQSNFDTNMAGVDNLAGAQQLANEQTAGQNRLTDLMNQIAQAQGDKAAAVAQAKDNAEQTQFGQLSNLAQLKANLAGNLYNEKAGLRQEQLSELGGLSNAVLGTALAGPQIQGAELSNALAAGNVAARTISNQGLKAQINSFIQQNGGAGNVSIGQLNPGTRSQVESMLTTKGGNYVNASGGLKLSPLMIKNQVMNQLTAGMGFKANDPQLTAFANNVLAQILTPARLKAWNAAH